MLKSVHLALLGAALTTASYAQPADSPLTLADCIHKALAVPSIVSVTRLDRQIADRDLSIARAGLLPQSSATVGTIYTSPSQLNRDTFAFIPANAIREYTGLAHIFQEIDTSGRLRADIARARASQQAAQASAGIAERDLKRAVSQAYYRLLFTRRLVSAISQSLEETQTFERRVKLLAEGGEAARADVVKASNQAAILRQTLTSAELAATLANQDLAAYWTAEVDTILKIEDTLDGVVQADQRSAEPPVGATGSASSPYLRRFEFSLLEAQKKGFEADARRTRALLLPQLTLGFNWGLDSYRVDWQHRGYSATAGFTVPVFDWFRTLNTARQFTARARQVAETQQVSQRRFSQEYSAASARVTRLLEQASQAREQVSLAEEDYKLSRVRYEGGEGAAVDVVVAQNQLVQARSNYYTTIANYLSAKLDLEVAAGR